MVCSPDDPDYERHIAYTEFFRRYSLPVPEMYAADRKQKQALFEDLGDLSLYSWLKCRRAPEKIEAIYRRVLGYTGNASYNCERKICRLPAACLHGSLTMNTSDGRQAIS